MWTSWENIQHEGAHTSAQECLDAFTFSFFFSWKSRNKIFVCIVKAEEWEWKWKSKTYNTSLLVLVNWVESDAHHHWPDPSLHTLTAVPSRLDCVALCVDAHAGKPIVDSTLDILVTTYTESRQGDVCGRNAEFFASTAKTLDDWS